MWVLRPWDGGGDWAGLTAGVADGVLGLDLPGIHKVEAGWRPRLGVMIETVDGVLRVLEVVAGSVAEVAGIKADDEIVSAAGVAIVEADELIAVIGRQAPGTWLPLTLNRGGQSRDVVAKFQGAP